MRNTLLRCCALVTLTSGLLLVPRCAVAQLVDVEVNDAGEALKHPDAVSKPTPHMANGHPDLNGVWHHYYNGAREGVKDGNSVKVVAKSPRRPVPPPTKPQYKPELVARMEDLKIHQAKVDPTFACRPPGVPRLGPPNQIAQTPAELVFLYSDLTGNYFRVIPTDGRSHNTDADPSYNGVSVGHWERDTLVVDATNFNDESWLGDNGWFHSSALHVTERLTRHGDTLVYEATVEDPKVLTQPWKMTPRTLTLQDDDLEEAPPCIEMDRSHLTDDSHHDNPR
jgi:hypothetical protein